MTTLVTIAPGHQLAPGPAAAYLRARAAGCPAGITSSYRDPAEQQRLRTLYLAGQYAAYVAPVERSEHVTGYALDLPAAPRAWMRDHPEFGFQFTDPTEAWHVAYRASRDQHLTTTPAAPAALTPIPQEDDMARLLKHPNGSIACVGPGPRMAVLHSPAEMDALRADGSVTGDLIDLGGSTLVWDLRVQIAQRAGVYSA